MTNNNQVYSINANAQNAYTESLLDKMKYEIAQEVGVNIGADATARQNGRVGGEMTKRLVEMAKNQLR